MVARAGAARYVAGMDPLARGPRGQPGDAAAEIERLELENFRAMSPDEKLQRIFELQDLADGMALADIRARHPGISEREARLRLASRKYPPELLVAAFGWDPLVRGY